MNDYFDQQIRGDRPPAEPAPSPNGEALPADPADPAEATSPASGGETEPTGTAPSLKAAVQELIKCGLVEKEAKPNLYRTLRQETAAVDAILEPLDLELSLDEFRGIAFLKIPAASAEDVDEAWQHPLVRRQRLTNEQSLLVAILRQAYIAYEQTHGIGAEGARIDLDELQSQFELYLGDSGSESRNSERLLRVIGQLHAHGIASEPDKENQVRIRPIIVHLANPEQLQLLLNHFKKIAQEHPAETASPPENSADED